MVMGHQSEVNLSRDHHRTSNADGGDVERHGHQVGGLGRQLSVYSLTLDEFQHVCEGGRSFGSMNMDEFLNSIWTAEENQVQTQNQIPAQTQMSCYHEDLDPSSSSCPGHYMMEKQRSLNLLRQGTLPAPLCRKTVDEVWMEIQKSHQLQQHRHQVAQRQATFGETTLEDFLVKAGVVWEQQCDPVQPLTPVSAVLGPSFVGRPILPYQAQGPDPKRNNGYTNVINNNGRGVVTGGGFEGGAGVGPVLSPVSSDGFCGPGSGGGQFGMEIVGLRSTTGRKRRMDGGVEKVVERREKRMIKNRESAARSRARKQAYTVELEAELNQLQKENAQLKNAMAHVERQRKQQYAEGKTGVEFSKAQRAEEKLKSMRRIRSCDL